MTYELYLNKAIKKYFNKMAIETMGLLRRLLVIDMLDTRDDTYHSQTTRISLPAIM